jgi:hypothetical protein
MAGRHLIVVVSGAIHVYQISLIVLSSLVVELESFSRMGATWTFLLDRQAQDRILLFIATASRSSTCISHYIANPGSPST